MREVYECNDCKFCANFSEYLVCLHPKLPASAVWDYEPVGDLSAENCPHAEFVSMWELLKHDYSSAETQEANAYAGEGDDYMQKMREWALEHARS